MKIRSKFVSNSSSSSFLCEICDRASVVYDGKTDDGEEIGECQKGHSFHINCLWKNFSSELKESYKNENDIDPYELPTKYCPICNLVVIKDDIITNYLLKKLNANRQEIEKEIRDQFSTLNDAFKAVKSK